MKTTNKWAALAALMVGTAGAQAALVNRGGGMVYDTTLNITWLADWNYAKTGGFDTDGMFDNWQAANNWANDLSYGGYTDWRLTKVAQPDASCSSKTPTFYGGYGCTGGEIGHLFYADFGGTGGVYLKDQTGQTQQQLDNLAMFSGSVPYGTYATGTDYVGDSDFTWGFGTDGSQGVVTKAGGSPFYALAVRDGDVAAQVPEPQSLALVLAALGLAGLARRRLG